MIDEYELYIDGKWLKSTSKKTFTSTNPANDEVLGYFQQGTEKDIDKAVVAAQKAFPEWSRTPAPVRGRILYKIAEILRRDKERLGRLVTREMGKQLSEGLGDVQEAIDIFEYMAGEGRRLFGHTTPSELKDKFAMTVLRPVGVCGLVTPWNFPIAIPAWKASAALITGNTIVLKPSSDTPLCATELVKIFIEAGVPAGVVNLVTGAGGTVGKRLVTHSKVRCISFTGHKDTGEWITKNAGLKKVGLELGSKNPIIVMDDADLKLAVDGIVWGAFGTTGQRCTAASRVIVHEKVLKKLEKLLLSEIKKLRVGDGLENDVGPLVNEKAVQKVEKYVKIGKREGKLLCGGNKVKGEGHFFEPTLFTNVKGDATIAQEEIFGPITALVPVKSLEEAIEVCNSVEYGLSSSIYTQDVNQAFKAIELLDFGLTYVNASTIGSEVHLPFGGTKKTGNGSREAGWMGIEEFSENKTVYVDYSGTLQRAQIDVEE